MGKKKKGQKHDPQWAQAKSVCRLNAQDIMMAKALGFSPKALMKNNPNGSQQWKAPVKEWIRDLFEKRFPGKPLPMPPEWLTNPPPKPTPPPHEDMGYYDYRDLGDPGDPPAWVTNLALKRSSNGPKPAPRVKRAKDVEFENHSDEIIPF